MTTKKIENLEHRMRGEKSEHPQLIGKYEVFKNDTSQSHISRWLEFYEAKKLCEQKHKQKRYESGQTIKIGCKKESKMIDENGRNLCKHHFNKWFKKKYKKDYDTFINEIV